jgi:hypothetical protein
MDCVLELAAGRLDFVICGASKAWDLAPGVDPDGGRRLDMGEGWYSNGLLHESVRTSMDQRRIGPNASSG